MKDYSAKLERLEPLNSLVEQYVPVMYLGSKDAQDLHKEICEVHGELADVYDEIAGRQQVDVPNDGGPGSSTYPNFFEAGFLSPRTFHTHQGRTELLKVIGQVRRRVTAPEATVQALGNRVFLVHGSDEAALHSCARFIEKLGLLVTVLREQANQGRTMIEKFVEHADVGFAVILLTPDDRGGPVAAPYEDQLFRARQNVIFELGFFLGRLGRERVCALYAGGVEVPSDYHGVAFGPFDSKMAWRLELARELKAAGLPIDMNRAA